MGQLIKLQDYISRYEQNIFHYPSRYVSLKKKHWEKIQSSWENGEELNNLQENHPVTDWYEEEKQPIIDKLKGMWKFGKKDLEVEEQEGIDDEINEAEDEEEHALFQFNPTFAVRPSNNIELKQQFLDQLIRFQMKWASSTLSEISNVEKQYYFDQNLKYFLQRFPDTFLILYHPIFLLKKAPVEVENIIITPTDVWCITFIEEEENDVFVGSKERFWTKRNQKGEKKVLNPMLALERTQKIVQRVFQMHEINLPIHKVLLSRNGYIDFPSAPYGTHLIEKRNYEEWFQMMRKNSSPLKHVQLKGANALLEYCQTTSFKRLEWEQVDFEHEGN